MRWVNETRWPASLSCLRRPSIAVTASVRNEVAVGIDRLSSMYLASMPAPPRSGWGVDAGAGAVTGSAGAGAPPFATGARTSAFVMRPPGPEPVTFARSIPSAAAMRAATGEILASDGIGCGSARGAAAPCPARAAAAGGGGLGRRLGRRGGGAGRGRRHARDDLADRDRVALPGEDLGDRPGGRGRELGVDLVGRDLRDGLAVLDGGPGGDVPLDERALGDRLAGGRGDYVERLP